MLSDLSGWHFVIILFIVLLIFGAPKLPGLAKSMGQSMKIFKNEIRSDAPKDADSAKDVGPAQDPASTTATTVADSPRKV
jgi:sec-independent protein translocase protein TatA